MGLFDDDEVEQTPVCYGNYLEPKISQTPQLKPTPDIVKQLTALQTMNFAYPDMSSETKSFKESQSDAKPTWQQKSAITFSYDSGLETASARFNPMMDKFQKVP